MNISFCPYRTNINWSTIQTTSVSQPLVYTGGARDVKSPEGGDGSASVEPLPATVEDAPDEDAGTSQLRVRACPTS